MECDDLIGTESDVAIVVACWHAGRCTQGKAASDEHLVALSRLLRLGNLAPSILESVLPGLPWFKESRLLRPFVHTFRRYGSNCAQLYPTLGIPAAWIAHARNGATHEAQQSKGPQELVWRVPVSAINEMAQSEAVPLFSSPVLYSNGVFFRAYVRLLRPSMQLRLSVELADSHGVPVPPVLDASLSIKLRRLEQRVDVCTQYPAIRRLAPQSSAITVVNEDVIVLVSASRLSWTMAVPSAEIIRLYPEVLFDGHLVFDIALQPK
ncbi:hypothetical protein DUNSADRAFT_759 [Dunaliella salina]|uniref:Uncharacterized protein n=1 Tax=Dunaliella salina TaxID=3046 RepID=A0ABQ7FYE6_DUNSA|nr:hypothetical protein DUNSADRAFT_759 [Dunaliella salina]|eukprot:KAF5827394.1 hypothetical protein DUNSADRAFT_759 [Dunaliella salina]